jgi:hypothetical protein
LSTKRSTGNERLSNTSPTTNRCEIRCFGSVCSSCSTSGTRRYCVVCLISDMWYFVDYCIVCLISDVWFFVDYCIVCLISDMWCFVDYCIVCLISDMWYFVDYCIVCLISDVWYFVDYCIVCLIVLLLNDTNIRSHGNRVEHQYT